MKNQFIIAFLKRLAGAFKLEVAHVHYNLMKHADDGRHVFCGTILRWVLSIMAYSSCTGSTQKGYPVHTSGMYKGRTVGVSKVDVHVHENVGKSVI